MKEITLHTAQVDNSGARRSAGSTVSVGSGKAAIAEDRAKALVSTKLAEAGSAPAKASGSGDKASD